MHKNEANKSVFKGLIFVIFRNFSVTIFFGVNNMVILFSRCKSTVQKEIADILYKFGGDLIEDKRIKLGSGDFTVLSVTKPQQLLLKNSIVVFCDENEKFENQVLPKGIIAICDSQNKIALGILKKNGVAAVTCGNSSKNTVTIASITDNSAIISLQRTLYDIKGKKIEPADFKIKLPPKFSPFSVMAAVAVLLLCGKAKKSD